MNAQGYYEFLNFFQVFVDCFVLVWVAVDVCWIVVSICGSIAVGC